MTLLKITFDYTKAQLVRPLRPDRDFGKFFSDAENASWEILNFYGIRRKRGQALPDQVATDRFSEAEVRIAVRVLENVQFGRTYWKALKAERGRAEAFAFIVGTIVEQFNGATRKATSATNTKRRNDRTVAERDIDANRNNRIRNKARELLDSGISKRKLITALIDFASLKNLSWPKSRPPYSDILDPSKRAK